MGDKRGTTNNMMWACLTMEDRRDGHVNRQNHDKSSNLGTLQPYFFKNYVETKSHWYGCTYMRICEQDLFNNSETHFSLKLTRRWLVMIN